MDLSGFSRRVIKARKEAGLSQVKTAEAMGLSRQTYLDLEFGRTDPRLSRIIKLADLFNCDKHWLAFGVDNALTERNQALVNKAKKALDELVL